MLDLGEIVLADERVRLRPLVGSDAAALALAGSEGREHYRFNPVPDGLADAESWVARALGSREAGARYPFVIEWQGRLVGSTSYSDYQLWNWLRGSPLQRSDRPDAVEIGSTWLAASAQHTDCNTRCKLLLLTRAFETWQVHRVGLRADARNERSRRAIERMGGKLDGVLRAHTWALDGGVRDSAFYSILAAEWPAVKARLAARIAA